MSLDTYDVLDPRADDATATPDTPSSPWWRRPEPIAALVGFTVFAVVVLGRASAMLEPDDYA